MTAAPLVSIFMFCKDRRHSIARALDSVLTQTWPNIEIVVQDGASTDGTLEILHGYGDAIKLISAPDDGSDDALLKALQRCRGAYVGSCLSDEELLPDAVERAVTYLDAHPDVGAITGDADIIDACGKRIGQHVGGDFVLQSYLTGDYCPYFVSSFFRKEALDRIGVTVEGAWDAMCVEFRIWCSLGARFDIDYVAQKFGRYGIHPGQLSNIPAAVDRHMDGRLATLAQMFSQDGPLATGTGYDHLLMRRLMAGQCAMQYNHLKVNRLEQAAQAYLERYLTQALAFATTLVEAAATKLNKSAVMAMALETPATLFRPDITQKLELLKHPRPAAAAPRRIVLPPLWPQMGEALAQTMERRGLARQAAHCRRLVQG